MLHRGTLDTALSEYLHGMNQNFRPRRRAGAPFILGMSVQHLINHLADGVQVIPLIPHSNLSFVFVYRGVA